MRAFTSSFDNLPYVSISCACGSAATLPVADEVFGQSAHNAAPLISTVAVTLPFCGTPVVSTVMLEVPCPLEIVPAETVQLYVTSPLDVAVKVIGVPGRATSVGPLTLSVGHVQFCWQSLHCA